MVARQRLTPHLITRYIFSPTTERHTVHDLNTINRLNTEAFETAIKNFQAQGRYVLATYEGLTLTAIETFPSADALSDGHYAALEKNPPATGTNFKTFPPTAGFHAAKRDQSEDRQQPLSLERLDQLARTGEKTLGDYIARKVD